LAIGQIAAWPTARSRLNTDSSLPVARLNHSSFAVLKSTAIEPGDPIMFITLANGYRRILGVAAATVVTYGTLSFASAQQKLSDPIYRVANDTSAAQSTAASPAPAPAIAAATQAIPAAAAAPAKVEFDLVQKPNEHPLMPVIRTVKASQEEIDRNVRDYQCQFTKQERINGELGEKQAILLKIMHQPFSVYMSFLQPFSGREVVYVAGQNNNDMVVLEAGFKRMLGKMNLDPNGALAMKGQKRPVTDVGIRNLTAKLIKMWEAETKFSESDVTTNTDAKINGRPATMLQVVHPVARQEFKFHVARLFLDNELKIPVHFDAYLWPTQAGGAPELEESYTYTNLKLNNGFTAREFDTNNNPEIFNNKK
jgi:Protein of unknown function (DUF1571)